MSATSRSRWLTAVVVAAVALPLLTLVLQAVADQWHAPAIVPQVYGPRGVHAVLDDPGLVAAVANSFLVAIAATATAMLLGWPVARLLSRSHHRAIGIGLLTITLLIPQAAIGTGLATTFLRLHLAGSLAGLTIAHLIQVLPYVTIALTAGCTPQLTQNEEAAETLGVTGWARFRLVTLPAMAPAGLVAAALGFTVSWSQYGSSLVVGAGTPMLPLTMVPYLRTDPQIGATLTLLFLAPPAIAALLATRATRDDRGATSSATTDTAAHPSTAVAPAVG